MSDKSTEQIFWELDAFIKCSVFSPPEDAIQNAHGLLAALRQRHEAMTQAVGLATTIKGDMAMRADDPIGMMQEVCAYVDTLRQRIEALELGINSALASEATMGGVDIAYLLDALGEQP